MSEMISRKFLIYEYAPGCAQSLTANSRREKIVLDLDSEGIVKGIVGEFVYSDEIEPAVECELKINPEAIKGWPDWKISGQVQQVLHFGITKANGIIPESDDPEYVFNRHGAEITKWIISEIRGKPPIGFHVHEAVRIVMSLLNEFLRFDSESRIITDGGTRRLKDCA